MKEETRQAPEKLITKPVTMPPSLAEQIQSLARSEDRNFAQMARVLIAEALQARKPQTNNALMPWLSQA